MTHENNVCANRAYKRLKRQGLKQIKSNDIWNS